MNYKYYIGLDISKTSIDYCFLQEGKPLVQGKIHNTLGGYKKLQAQARALNLSLKEVLFCLEHTGEYSKRVLKWLNQTEMKVWLESPLAIKRSLGLTRGKNDKVDAYRIALYAYRFEDQAVLWEKPRLELEQLQQLTSWRKHLVGSVSSLETRLKESQDHLDKRVVKSSQKILKGLKEELKQVNDLIQAHIKKDKELSDQHKQVSSVHGVGKVLAAELMVTTNEFKRFSSAKQLACYAGVAPFEHRSGSSIRGKTRVSRLANMGLKKLLHMAAISCLRKGNELYEFYQKKVAQGKAKMAVINAIRNKIIHRIFACVRDNRLYEKNMPPALA